MLKIDYKLYLVTDRMMAGSRSLCDVVLAAVAGGVTMVQLRDKQASARDLVRQAVELSRLLRPAGIPLIVNDRLDVALASGADGVHLGQNDLPCHHARSLAPTGFLVGISVSTPREARQAMTAGADYLGVSPVFDTQTKRDTPAAAGLEGLARIRAVTALPLVAIGGLDTGNSSAVVQAGADGIAVVSAIMASDDPKRAAKDLIRVLG